MKFVPNVRRAWRWFSMQMVALIAIVQVAWETLPAEALAVIGPDLRGWITLGLCIAAALGRVIDQGTAGAAN